MASIHDLVTDLEEGRIDLGRAQEIASRLEPEESTRRELGALVSEAIGAYDDGKTQRAWAAAVIAAAVAKAWSDRPARLWPRRIAIRESSLDVRGRALGVLALIAADRGDEDAAANLNQESETTLRRMTASSTGARFSIGAIAAERALRVRRADEARAILERVLNLPSLNHAQRAAAQALQSAAFRASGRSGEADQMLERSAESFRDGGQPCGELAADFERAVWVVQSGDLSAGRSLLQRVADAAEVSGCDKVEISAHLHLGLHTPNKEHRQAATHFEKAASAARRMADTSSLIIALRNAANELRQAGDLVRADEMLAEALSWPETPALIVERAKTRYHLAVLRRQQGRAEEARRLLDEATTALEDKLSDLGPDGNALARQHLERELRIVASLREQLSR